MPVEFVSVEEARNRGGLRMVVVSGVPSPWGEAAKGILHVKGIDWVAVRLAQDDEGLAAWTGRRDGPVAIWESEPPRHGWAEILLLAERLAPEPALLPADPAARALALGLAHEICGEQGLSWTRRVQLIHAGLAGAGGFAEPVAKYLAAKYGYTAELGAAAPKRMAALLGMLADRLKAQERAGSPWFLGDAPTAVDIYAATAMALFAPLPEAQCAMHPRARAAFESSDAITGAALDPILLAHRDRMYAEALELPLSL